MGECKTTLFGSIKEIVCFINHTQSGKFKTKNIKKASDDTKLKELEEQVYINIDAIN